MKKVASIILLILAALLILMVAGCSDNNSTNNNNTNPPAAPSSLTASQALRTAVTVTWSSVSDADTFLVQRGPDTSHFAALTGAAHGATTITDNAIYANTKYYYRVMGRNANGDGAYSPVAKIYSWPAVYNFSSNQTAYFSAYSLDAGNDYHTWQWVDQAGKLTITTPTANQHLVSVVSDSAMPNQGWFECQLKVEAWHAGADPSEVLYYVSHDPTNPTAETVALRFSQSATKFGYYPNGVDTMTVLTSSLPALAEGNTFHTVRMLHDGSDWTVQVDNTTYTGSIPNVLMSGTLTQIWQFDRGDGPDNQVFWLDDVANPGHNPAITGDNGNTPVVQGAHLGHAPAARR